MNEQREITDPELEQALVDLRVTLRVARWYVERYEPRDVSEAHDRDLMLTSIDELCAVKSWSEQGSTKDLSSAAFYDGPVWNFFCLTYSAYLVLPRVSLCSMPVVWQRRFVALMEEAERVLPPEGQGGRYMVRKLDGNKFAKDPLANYRHHGPLKLVNGPRRHEIR
jgi:hypothetical protein